MSLQQQIETQMEILSNGKRWEYMVLFSSEGLPLASFGIPKIYSEDELLEFSFQLLKTLPLIKEYHRIQRIRIEVQGGMLLVFHFFEGLEDQLILAVVVRKSIPWKQRINQMIRFLQTLNPYSGHE